MRQTNAAKRKELTDEQKKIRRSIPGYVIKKNLTRGARHGQRMQQCVYYKTHDMLKEARKYKKKMVTEACWTDGTLMSSTASLCQMMGGLKNISFKMINIIGRTFQNDYKKEVGTENPEKKFFESRMYSRTYESPQCHDRSETKMQKTAGRMYSNHWR